MAMVRELPVSDRPRERLINHGAHYLSNVELLALLIRSGSKDMSAIQLAEQVLCVYKGSGMAAMANVTVGDLTKVKGIGYAKAAEIVAAVELGRRLYRESLGNRVAVNCPGDAAAYAMTRLRHEQKEHFEIILLNVRNQIMSMQLISIGSLTASVVHPREVFKAAVQGTAASIILVHNHPSGDPEPSKEDISITRRLVRAGEIMGIPVLDHIVIGDGRYVSIKEEGFME